MVEQSGSFSDQFDRLVKPKIDNITIEPPLQTEQSILEPTHLETKITGDDVTSLSALLVDKNYHPVLIFGTRASGKSTLLTSLFSYFQTDPKSAASCYLGEWIIPVETVAGSMIADEASRFFNRVVSDFHSGTAAASTQFILPFFIPVVIKPNNKKPTINVALFESSGELYQVNKDSSRYHPDLRPEIKEIYENYSGTLSIVIIAPYIMSEAYSGLEIADEKITEEFRLTDDALLASLQNYQKYRKFPEKDRLNFILTKWDVHMDGISNKGFVEPPEGLVEHLIHQRFPKAWVNFGNLKDASNNSMVVMPYSSGLISGREALPIPTQFKARINIFPRTLWNWIYIGASNGIPLYGVAKSNSKKSWVVKFLQLFY